MEQESMRYRVISFRSIKETRAHGFVSLSSLPHDYQQVVFYTEKAPNAWQRRGTQTTRSPTINPIGPTDKPHRLSTKHYRSRHVATDVHTHFFLCDTTLQNDVSLSGNGLRTRRGWRRASGAYLYVLIS